MKTIQCTWIKDAGSWRALCSELARPGDELVIVAKDGRTARRIACTYGLVPASIDPEGRDPAEVAAHVAQYKREAIGHTIASLSLIIADAGFFPVTTARHTKMIADLTARLNEVVAIEEDGMPVTHTDDLEVLRVSRALATATEDQVSTILATY